MMDDATTSSGPRAGLPTQRSADLYRLAQSYLPGGVSAAARYHPSLGRPFYVSRGEGSRVWDVDGREYIDLNMSFGAALLGHGHPAVRRAVEEALQLGVLCGFETEYQTRVARKITEYVPSAELVRFSGSGTETTWHAARTARVYTGRSKLVKFEGHFHGFNDVLGFSFWPTHAEAGPADSPRAVPESGGIPPANAADVIVLPWNDVRAVERCLESRGHEIAAVIMEPINHNSGTILPVPGYLKTVRDLTRRYGVVLIFDEILSGFRMGTGCAQSHFGVIPDMCTLGKCLGGGLPLSAFAGSREIMQAVAPLGSAVHSGTFNAHPVPILAADAFLDVIGDPDFWTRLEENERFFYRELRELFSRAGITVRVQAAGARFSLLFGLDHEPRDYRDVSVCDRALEARFYRACLERGVYFHYARHHGFSALHTREDLEQALGRIEDAALAVRRS